MSSRAPFQIAGAAVLLLLAAGNAIALEETVFEPFVGMTVTDLTFSGNNTTHEHVIRLWLEIQEGDTLVFETLDEDVGRLENLSIFGFINVEPSGTEGGVALEYVFREMPSYIPYIAFRFTEQNGFSVGPAISAVNLGGKAARVSGRLLFGGTTTFILSYKNPWIPRFKKKRIEVTFDASYLQRLDELNEFNETSVEVTPWIAHYKGASFLEWMAGTSRWGRTKTEDARSQQHRQLLPVRRRGRARHAGFVARPGPRLVDRGRGDRLRGRRELSQHELRRPALATL